MTIAQRIDERLERLGRLSPEQRARVLEALRRGRDGNPEPRVRSRRGSGPAPLSFAQQRLWFIDQLVPNNAAYNIAFAVHLEGELDGAALILALRRVEERHEVLRTHFERRGGELVQVVHPTPRSRLPHVDLSALSGDSRQATLEAIGAAVAWRPFRLDRGPLLRAVLVRLGEQSHRVVACVHHAIFDGWSEPLFLAEVAAAYDAVRRGTEPELPELVVQYGDYAAWQRERLQGAHLAALLEAWRQRLAGAPTLLELPTDRPRPPVQTHRGGVLPFRLSERTSAALRAFGRERRATPFMVLLAAFGTLLGRLANQSEVLVGSPVAGRVTPELEPLVGCFVNTLVLRTSLAGAPGFGEMVERARTVALEAFEHQDLPLELLLEQLKLERELGHSPLFQAVFVLQNAPRREVRRSGIDFELLGIPGDSAKFDLTLSVIDSEGPLEGALEYNRDLFDDTTVRRWTRAFRLLVEAALEDRERPVTSVPLLDEAERQALRVEWNGGGGQFPVFLLHERFAAVASVRGGSVAVRYGERELTYGELASRASRLASRLADLGVGPEVRVGLCLERSEELVVAILGVLWAGGAYVPLDPEAPAERLAYVLEDSAAPVVVARGETAARVAGGPARVLDLAELDAAELEVADPGAAGARLPVAASLTPDHAAYVIYTSGSTGRPKGVVVTHGQVSRLFTATQGWFGFGESDVWTLFHSYAFDFSVWELWGALLHGGRLVVVPYLVSRSPRDFRALLAAEGVTVLNQTPSAFRQLVRAEEELAAEAEQAATALPELSLRSVVFGGEALELEALRPWLLRHGEERPRLVNMYGITETTVHVTYRPVTWSDVEQGLPSVVGGPIPDLAVHLLDRWGCPAPTGTAGELCVGGSGVARGYLGRPGLTAERFVPDPFGGEPGARLYRSGDLARRRPDSDLQYLGRIDQQVKIRGHRIELGEVEAALASHPAVAEAAVVADGKGAGRLVGYVSFRGGAAEPSLPELRSHLARTLPDYMVPAVLIVLPALPLTTNGKVDRRSLPAPGSERPDLGQAPVPPRTRVEADLAAAWRQVLGVEEVGVHDNFFALGGDSIRSMQVLSRARERGIDLSLQQLFRLQTIAELAADLETGEGAAHEALTSTAFSLVAPEDRARMPEDVVDAYPLTEMQSAMLYHMELTPDEPLYHNVDSWHLRARFAVEPFRSALQRAIDRHEVLRTSYDLTRYRQPLQLVHRHADAVVTVEDLRGLRGAAQEAVIDDFLVAEKRRPCDLTRPPLLRFHIHLRADDRFQLTLSENHAVWDGWSLHATLADVFTDCFDLLRGVEPAERPPLALRYRDFVALERQALESQETRAYFERVLADLTVSRLPRRSRGEGPAGRVGLVRRLLPGELPERLKTAAAAAGVPLKDLLLAVHLKVLSCATGRVDVVTGIVTHGRPEHPQGDDLRGLFLNTLPLRLRVRPGSWTQLARDAFRAEQELLPHRRFPIAALQRLRGGALPFEAVFNYINFHAVEKLLGSGEVEELDFKKAEGTDQTLIVHFEPDGLQLEYATGELTEEQVEELAERYVRALRQVAADPDGRHDADPDDGLFVEEVERLDAWGLAAEEASWPGTVPELLARQAARTPVRVAVEQWTPSGRLSWSYGELVRRVAAVAAALARRGIGPGSTVGVFVARTPDLPLATLSVMAAGAAYLPLDPAFPVERLAYVLEDAGADAVLTHGAVSSPPPFGGVVVRLEDLLEEPVGAAPPPPDPDLPAYLIYTSGSTGHPKGVVVSHRALVNFLASMADRPGLGADDVLVAVTSLSFDIAGLELYLPLLVGARLVVASREQAADGTLLARLLDDAGATALQATPATWRMLFESGWSGSPRLTALCGGEPLPRVLAAALAGATRATWNLYGPTETTIWSSVADLSSGGEVHVGQPIANTDVHLVDALGRRVPPGVPGELVIGGAGLARGYRSRPGLTAERFVPDPFSRRTGARLYRTGDLARWRPDGRLDHLGRLDQQIKIRGFRVEPGEIEAALERTAAVEAAAVVLRRLGTGEEGLVAYVVAAAGAAADPSALREALRRELPDYMVPGLFVSLAELPLTPNGKVDRRALPAPDREAERQEGLPVRRARSPLELQVFEVWEEVLGLSGFGIDEDFLALGGHSLLATRIVSRLRRTFGVELPLAALFEGRTVAGLARRLEGALGAAAGAPPLVPLAQRDGAPASFAQRRLWILDQLQGPDASYHLPLRLRVAGRLRPAALAASLGELQRRHHVLRTVLEERQGEPVQRILPPVPVGLPRVDLSALPGERLQTTVERVLDAESVRPFDLAAGPLWRAVLVRLGDEEHALSLTVHHVAGDGWSMEVLVRELAATYRALVAGEVAPLGDLPLQYADFAAWQRRWLQGETLRREVDHWRRSLDGVEALELPTDRPRPPVQSHRGAAVTRRLDQRRAAELRDLGRREGASLYMVLLSAFLVVLGRHSGQDDFAVGTPVAGRGADPDLERLIGFLINVVVLRADLGGRPDFRTLLSRVRRTTLAALAHQDLPFEALLEELQPTRDLSRTPLFQVFFNLLNYERAVERLPGLTIEPFPLSERTSKFDLTLYGTEMPEAAGGDLQLTLVYASDLFDAARMEGMLEQVVAVLEAAVEDPARPVHAVSLVTGSAAARLPDPAEGLASAWPGPVHELFTARARREPRAIALADGGGRWTYGDLDERSGHLAAALAAAGVGRGDRVAVFAHRGAALAWALLGVLRAGAAYLVLDAHYPGARLARYVELAEPAALVRLAAAGPLPDALCAWAEALPRQRHAVLPAGGVESARRWNGGVDAAPPTVTVTADDVGYVAFTSGSDGEPKGVLGRHGPLSHFLPWHAATFGLGAEDRFSLLSGLAHDPLQRDLFLPLVLGASVWAPPEEVFEVPGELVRWLAREGITVAHLTPAMARLLATAPRGEVLPRLRWARFVGEALTRADVERLRERAPRARIANFYGTTETQAALAMQPVIGEVAGTVPLGRGIPGVQLLVLSSSGDLAGIGELGELAVRSPHLAAGYLDDPARTAACFMPAPGVGGTADGERIYRTGDLGRFLPDGSVAFSGRRDEQINVRGFRVEPAEVAAQLERLPEVTDAAVLALDGALVAWVVAAPDRPRPSEDDLRRALELRLPAFMVPARVLLLDRLPLTPNGKLDRRALPLPEGPPARLESVPRSAAEMALAAAWEDVLAGGPVGLDDNFFALGGDSIRAIQVAARAAEAGYPVAVGDLFQHQTVRTLAAAAGAARPAAPAAPAAAGAEPPATAVRLAERLAAEGLDVDAVLPLTGTQEGILLQSRFSGDEIYFEQLRCTFEGRLNPAVFRAAWRQLVQRHAALRTGFLWEGLDEPLQVVHRDPRLEVAIVDLSRLEPAARRARIAAAARRDRRRGFDLSAPPLMRLALFVGGTAASGRPRHTLLWSRHHLVMDGWSLGIVVEELFALYAAGVDPRAHASGAAAGAVRLSSLRRLAPELGSGPGASVVASPPGRFRNAHRAAGGAVAAAVAAVVRGQWSARRRPLRGGHRPAARLRAPVPADAQHGGAGKPRPPVVALRAPRRRRLRGGVLGAAGGAPGGPAGGGTVHQHRAGPHSGAGVGAARGLAPGAAAGGGRGIEPRLPSPERHPRAVRAAAEPAALRDPVGLRKLPLHRRWYWSCGDRRRPRPARGRGPPPHELPPFRGGGDRGAARPARSLRPAAHR